MICRLSNLLLFLAIDISNFIFPFNQKIDNGIIVDYAMNTLCAAGTGSFLSSQSKRLDIDINDFGPLALKSNNPAKIAARCTVFAESDLVHKAQLGYKKEDIAAGLCRSIVINYLNNVCKGKKLKPPIMFQGGVSKNIGVVKAFEDILGEKVIVDKDSHLMGALGIAILSKKEIEIDISLDDKLIDLISELGILINILFSFLCFRFPQTKNI